MREKKSIYGVSMNTKPQYSFEIPPDPIPDHRISEIVSTEIVVVGAGTAGLVCANAAVENGAKVILISASSFPVARGGSNHAINSKLTRELGITYDVGKNIKREIDRAGGRIDQEKWFLFARKSGEAMDWLIDKMVAAGLKPVLEMTAKDPDDIMSPFPGAHGFIRPDMKKTGATQMLVVNILAKLALRAGVRIHYNTIAEQLVREDDNTGRVTAVIARNQEDQYIKYVGSKAIVLATGDFTKDREMVAKYCPEVSSLIDTTPVDYSAKVSRKGGVYAGDGHKMGLWVGAAWQRTTPNAPMLIGGPGPEAGAYSGFKGLLVNRNAVRFTNEDVNRTHTAYLQMQQPEMQVFAIWNREYAQRMAPWYPFGSYIGSPARPVTDIIDDWEKNVETGTMVKAETIDALAGRLCLDPGRLNATIERYNTFCDGGEDIDFYKRPSLLIPLRKGPFYGQSDDRPILLIVCGGLRCNGNMQVLDLRDRIIPGLYVIGTLVGDMFANYYSFMPSGINYGATCITFGYLVGKAIAVSG